jgi:small subunit ribosomal protein S8e
MKYQGKSGKKETGGKLIPHRKKKKFELGSEPTATLIGAVRKKEARGLGGNMKIKAFACDFANVTDRKTGISKKVKIETVVENRANPYFVRRNIITKGAIIRTELGNARVTSRPGQEGVVSAVLLTQ